MCTDDNFPDEQLLIISIKKDTPWFADLVKYLVAKVIPPKLSYQQKKKFFADLKHYFWEDLILYGCYANQIIRRCIPEDEMRPILEHCHSFECEADFRDNKTSAKLLQVGYNWPPLFKDAHVFVMTCDKCQRIRNISDRNAMPLKTILEVELFDLWGINFMGSFLSSYGNY